jgi:hypothetical protein
MLTKSGLYFSNSFTASPKSQEMGPPTEQTLYINKEGKNITQKEAYNRVSRSTGNQATTMRDCDLSLYSACPFSLPFL